jgi:type I restriction enzyme S subunit
MDTDDLRIRRRGEITDDYLGPAFHMRFKPGHVLYGSRRTYLRKVAVPDFEGICANTTFVLESSDPKFLLPELLPFIMQMEAFHAFCVQNSKGSVNPYINFSDLAEYEFALPPLAEQRRIGALLSASETAVNCALETVHAAELLLKAATEDIAEDAAKQGTTARVAQLVREDKPITHGILMPGTGYAGGVECH